VSKNLGAIAIMLSSGLWSFSSGPAFAQVANAGSLGRQSQDEAARARSDQTEAKPNPVKIERGDDAQRLQSAKEASVVRVFVKEFQFSGAVSVPAEKLQAALAKFSGRELSFAELEEAKRLVVDTYAKQGFIAIISLPPQDVTSGTIRFVVKEAQLGQLGVEVQNSRNVNFDVLRMFRKPQPGDTLDLNEIERRLTLLGSLPGVSASGKLSAGKLDGHTDVNILVRGDRKFNSYIEADSNSSAAVGQARGMAVLAVNNPFGFGDTANAFASKSEGSFAWGVGYEVPWGDMQWYLGGNYSRLRYHLVGEVAQGARGTSEFVKFSAGRRAWVSRDVKLWGGLNVGRNRFRDGFSEGGYDRGYKVDYVSGVMGGGIYRQHSGLQFNTSITAGRKTQTIGDTGCVLSPQSCDEGRFAKGTIDAAYSLRRGRVVLSLNARGQYAERNLPSAEKIYPGGFEGVRAYSVEEPGGIQGGIAQVDIAYRLSSRLSVKAFYDFAWVRQYAAGTADASMRNELVFQGLGLGTELAINQLTLSAFAALPVAPSRANQDLNSTIPASRSPRFGVRSSLRF